MNDVAANIHNDAKLGALPEWDLTDLYPAPDSPEIKQDLETAEARAKKFAETYQGKLAAMTGDSIGQSIAEYESLSDRLGKLMSYAQLRYAQQVSDPERGRFYQWMQERVSDVSTLTLFFTLELNRLDDKLLEEKLRAPAVARYRPWLRDLRAFRPHQLDDSLEKLLHEKDVAGRSAFNRLFDETMADMRFILDGNELTQAEVLNMLSDRDGEVRRKAAKAFGKGLGEKIRLFSLITNTLAKDKEIEDKWRNFPRPTSSRNLANRVEDEVVDALAKAVQDSYPRLSHRYYALKAKWFGRDTLDYWDRNAPLPDSDDRLWSWDEARDLVLRAYGEFSEELAGHGRKFFGNGWIDAPARPGKDSGAFAHPTVASAHPYLMLNYLGKTRDVMTLAHELGHGVHQVLAAGQGELMAHTPLTLAETASVFGEMLTFQSLLNNAQNPKQRRAMLASKVEDMLNTVVRQIAFYSFEREVHDQRRSGELSAEQLGDIWMKAQTDSLGPVFRFDEEYRNFWAYIPHFIHSPFYVYAYAFGDCLVNSLYDVYRQGSPGFQQKYLDMLAAGGTLRHKELLAPFGLDASDPNFWKRGLDVISGMIDELEELS